MAPLKVFFQVFLQEFIPGFFEKFLLVSSKGCLLRFFQGFFQNSFRGSTRVSFIDFLRDSFRDFFRDFFTNASGVFIKNYSLDSLRYFFRNVPWDSSIGLPEFF